MTKTSTKKLARKTLSVPKKPAKPVQEATPAPESAPAATPPEPTAPALEAAAAVPAKPKAKAAAPKAPRPRGKSVQIYEASLRWPQKSGPEIAELLIAQGLKSTAETIQTIRSDFVRSVTFLAEQGLMKSPFIKE